MHHYYLGPWRGLSGGIVMLVPILLIGVILFAAYKLFQGSSRSGNSKSEALEILDRKYASGELSEEEYKKKKSDILS